MATDERHAHDGLHGRGPRERDALVRDHLPDRHVRVDEGNPGGGDDNVGVGHEVQPAPGTHPVDRRDHGLPDVEVPAREPQLGVAGLAAELSHRVLVAGELHHVDTRLERGAVAGVDDDPNGGVGVELEPRIFELGHHGGVHRVAGGGPVEYQPAHTAMPFDLERAVRRHRRKLIRCTPISDITGVGHG